jgi:hypothetical protein
VRLNEGVAAPPVRKAKHGTPVNRIIRDKIR